MLRHRTGRCNLAGGVVRVVKLLKLLELDGNIELFCVITVSNIITSTRCKSNMHSQL